MITRSFRNVGVLLLAAGALGGCAAPLFRAGFDTDPLGVPPLARPPGPPDDSITTSVRRGFVTVIANGTDGRRVLLGSSDAGGTAQMFTISAPLGTTYQRGAPIYASWRGWQVGGRTEISVWAGHFNTLALFEITEGNVLSGGRTLGRIADPERGGAHVMVWRLDPASATAVLTVFPDRLAGAPSGTTPQRFTIADPRLADLASAPVLGLLFAADSSNADFGYYFVDDVVIGQRAPPSSEKRMAPPPER